MLCMSLTLTFCRNKFPSWGLISHKSHIKSLMTRTVLWIRLFFSSRLFSLVSSFKIYFFLIFSPLSLLLIWSISFLHFPTLSHCIQQILESVHHCHVNGIVHRDLKVCMTTDIAATLLTKQTDKKSWLGSNREKIPFCPLHIFVLLLLCFVL